MLLSQVGVGALISILCLENPNVVPKVFLAHRILPHCLLLANMLSSLQQKQFRLWIIHFLCKLCCWNMGTNPRTCMSSCIVDRRIVIIDYKFITQFCSSEFMLNMLNMIGHMLNMNLNIAPTNKDGNELLTGIQICAFCKWKRDIQTNKGHSILLKHTFFRKCKVWL